MMKYAMCCLALVLSVCAAFATDVQLLGTARATKAEQWTNTTLWEGGRAPNEATDDAQLYVSGNSKPFAVQFPNSDLSLHSISDSIDGGETYIRFNGAHRLSVAQLSGYDNVIPFGLYWKNAWQSLSPRAGLNFTGTTAVPTLLDKFFVFNLPYLGVSAADGLAQVGAVTGRGMVIKDGAGELQINGPIGVDSGFFLDEGTLTLSSVAEATAESPAPGAFFRLDASKADSRQEDVRDGRTYVTNWMDATGNGFHAYDDGYAKGEITAGCPYLSERTVNGRALIDFGPYVRFAEGQRAAHPAGALKWSAKSTQVREVFLAVAMTSCEKSSNNDPQPAVIGDAAKMNFMMNSTTNSLFAGYAAAAVRAGDVRINGTPVPATDYDGDPLAFRIISVKTRSACTGGYLGLERNTARGGFLLGEVVVYTNELTEAARRQTIAYLKGRWLDAATQQTERLEWGVGTVVAAAGTTVKVPADDVVRVKRVSMRGDDGLVKAGDGTLSVERMDSSAPIRVAGGAVRFADRLGAAATTGLPSDPAWHFDAADADSFTYGAGDVIATWHDVRTGSYMVATPLVSGAVRTTGASPTGLAAVDFGTTVGAGGPRLGFETKPVYEGFSVWRFQSTSGMPQPFAAKGLNDWNRGTENVLLTGGTYYPHALFTLNGVPFNPTDTSFGDLGGDSGWCVVHFSSEVPMTVDAMSSYGKNATGGGCQIGELVGYDRPLTDRERRDAEAYLMKRWLDKPHPDNETWRGALAFDSGVPAVIDTDRDIAPASVSAAAAVLTKKGAGAADIGLLDGGFSSVAVTEGELETTLPLLGEAVYHFDAADTNTFDMVENGDGSYAISTWRDVRRNGKKTTADLTHCLTNPVYRVSDGTDGLLAGSGYVDFGATCGSLTKIGNVATNKTSASFTLGDGSTSVMELHFVWADGAKDTTANKYGVPVGNNKNSSDQSGFLRYGNELNYKGFNNMLVDARLNAVAVDATKEKKTVTFDVISYVVTNHAGTLTSGIVRALANDRNITVGGVKLAEVILFETIQTPERRSAIDAYLLKKWRGIGEGAAFAHSTAFSVSAGATLRFDGLDLPKVASVSGAGAIVATSLATDSLTLDCASATQTGMTQSGAFDLPANGRVRVTVPASELKGVTRIPVLTAKSLSNVANVASWTIENLSGVRKGLSLSVDGNVVYLNITATGLMLIFR